MKRNLLFALALLVGTGAPALAHDHEEGVIRLGAKEVRTGSALAIRGEKLPKRATLRLELRGTLETFALGTVKTDTAGAFTAHPVLPAEAGAGHYTVIALASDGDVVGRAELAVIAAPAETAGHEADHGHTHAAETAAPRATDEMMALPVSRSPAEWFAILAILSGAFGGGLVLLRGRGA
ncbi:MAG TPA: hypothetical protein VF188_16495 [Longimicrobiales bacterium]